MTGTFSSLNTALSALRYQRVAMDTASNNLANAATPGYTRQRVEAAALGAPAAPALWSRYEGAGDGVGVAGLRRLNDPFLDLRARREHGHQAQLDTVQSVLDRVEAGIGEPGDTGVSAALTNLSKAWQDLANAPGSAAARGQLLGKAQTVVEALGTQARAVLGEAADDRARVQSMVAEVNTLSSDLAATNVAIASGQANDVDVNTLLDKRDQLALRLAELTGATSTARPDGGVDVTVGGVPLVTGKDAGTVAVATGITAGGGADGAALTFAISPPGDPAGTPVAVPTTGAAVLGGELGGMTQVLSTTLPDFLRSLDTIAQQLADTVNAVHRGGYDQAGTAGGDFFSYASGGAPGSLTTSLAVAVTDPAKVAASSLPGGVVDGGNALALGKLGATSTAYAGHVTAFGNTVASATRLATNQHTLTTQVDAAREQLSGVSIDEEMVSLVAAQRAFEAAGRVMSTMDSVLDTIINRMGA